MAGGPAEAQCSCRSATCYSQVRDENAERDGVADQFDQPCAEVQAKVVARLRGAKGWRCPKTHPFTFALVYETHSFFGESGLLENEPTAPAEQAHTTQRQ